jgi:hypothetical protein
MKDFRTPAEAIPDQQRVPASDLRAFQKKLSQAESKRMTSRNSNWMKCCA